MGIEWESNHKKEAKKNNFLLPLILTKSYEMCVIKKSFVLTIIQHVISGNENKRYDDLILPLSYPFLTYNHISSVKVYFFQQ